MGDVNVYDHDENNFDSNSDSNSNSNSNQSNESNEESSDNSYSATPISDDINNYYQHGQHPINLKKSYSAKKRLSNNMNINHIEPQYEHHHKKHKNQKRRSSNNRHSHLVNGDDIDGYNNRYNHDLSTNSSYSDHSKHREQHKRNK